MTHDPGPVRATERLTNCPVSGPMINCLARWHGCPTFPRRLVPAGFPRNGRGKSPAGGCPGGTFSRSGTVITQGYSQSDLKG